MNKANGISSLIKALMIAYIVTGVLLFIWAFLMYKFGLKEQIVQFGVTFIYIIANAIAGVLVGRSMKQRKFLWGALVGLIYVGIVFLVSLIASGGCGMIMAEGLSTFMLCVGGGMLGGMIS